MMTATATDYERIFETECAQRYPVVDEFEQRQGFWLDQRMVEDAARVLACPLKTNPPNWQHGRVLYAVARKYLSGRKEWPCTCVSVMEWNPCQGCRENAVLMLDVGTAKGYSALCLKWALMDSRLPGHVWSVDVLDPAARVQRNTVAEVDGYQTLAEILSPWPEAADIRFECSSGIDWLLRHPGRVHVAFVDGKHSADVVLKEGKLLADRQEAGDLVMFDDCQIPGVAKAVSQLDMYQLEYLDVKPGRRYAIGVRR